MPQAVLEEIYLTYEKFGIRRLKTEMFNKWLARDPEASWTKVEAALGKIGRDTEAVAVRKRYLGGARTDGTTAQQPARHQQCELCQYL